MERGVSGDTAMSPQVNPYDHEARITGGSFTVVDPMLQLQIQLNRIEAKLDELLGMVLDEEHSKARLREAFARYVGVTE
jgi:hypothetical protein